MDRMFVKAGVIVCLPLLMASCVVTGKTEKRYKRLTTRIYPATKDSIKYFVAVNGYVTNVPGKQHHAGTGNGAKNIFSLSGEGQKQLIESIADNEESTDEIYNKLAQDIVPAKHVHAASTGGRKFNRRIVLAIDDMHMTAADRIQKLTITIAPQPGSNVKAIACNKLSNNNHKPVKDASGAAADAIAQSALIADDGAIITLANMDGNEMTGNVYADMTFEYSGEMKRDAIFSFGNLWNRDRSAVKPNEITLSRYAAQMPANGVAGKFAITYTATVRHVAKGENTINEKDDVVEVITGKGTGNELTVAGARQLHLSQWEISFAGKHLELGGNVYNGAILFSSYEEAQDFLVWLKRSSADILANNRICNGDYKIVVSGDGNVLTDSFIENCKVTEVK